MSEVNEKVINMNRKEVIDFIKRIIQKDKLSNVEEGIIESILEIIPLLGHYEEEDKKINFGIAIGMGVDIIKVKDEVMKDLSLYYYKIKKRNCEKEKSEDVKKIVNKMIKRMAIFCKTNANICLFQNGNTIECGIYISKLYTTKKAEESLLGENFIIFENLYKNKVVVKAKNEKMYICMDFDEDNVSEYTKHNEEASKYSVCRKWEGIFEMVRRNVHGTICLFVDSKWNYKDDKNFKISDTVDLDLKINDDPDAEAIQNFNNQLNMFLAMLDYDGITIVDTSEKIRAYNLFCNIKDDNEENINGGARHRAYEYLKNLDKSYRNNYVAIYFQSQEGEIEFYWYDYDQGQSQEGETLNPTHYFDASIMNTKIAIGNSKNTEMKDNHKKVQQLCIDKIKDDDKDLYLKLGNLVNKLEDAHKGIDNFYNEPVNAEKLEEFIKNNKQDVNKLLNENTKMRKYLLNIVFRCIVGHCSGHSIRAQKYLKSIISYIKEDVYNKYFTNDEYLDYQLLWSISSPFLIERWENILNDIKNMYSNINELIEGKTYTCEEYKDMVNALTDDDI